MTSFYSNRLLISTFVIFEIHESSKTINSKSHKMLLSTVRVKQTAKGRKIDKKFPLSKFFFFLIFQQYNFEFDF